jgi:hypothetical protein
VPTLGRLMNLPLLKAKAAPWEGRVLFMTLIPAQGESLKPKLGTGGPNKSPTPRNRRSWGRAR